MVSYDSLNRFATLDQTGGDWNDALSSMQKITNAVSTVADVTSNILETTKSGSNVAYLIANNKVLLQSAKALKPIGYAALGFNVPYDIHLSNTGQQSWSKTILNTSVGLSAIVVGGWYGLAIAGLYTLGDVGTDMMMKGLEQGIISPNPNLMQNYIPGLGPAIVIQ